jgi:predicted  nucleic acid-binding Zn-ribbon protein
MKLRALKLLPSSPDGWESEELEFGKFVTELFAPNGSGKTPVIQSIAFALGFPVKYRDDVLQMCSAVRLVLSGREGDIQIVRRLGERFDVEVTGYGYERHYFEEKAFSEFLLDMMGLEFPNLTSNSNTATTPYISTVLPLFYLDQDRGYTSVYSSPATFINDQYAEMMRLILRLPPKHAFENRKLRIDKKKRLEELNLAVVNGREGVESMLKAVGKERREIEKIQTELGFALKQLNTLRNDRHAVDEAEFALKDIYAERRAERKQILEEMRDLQSRVDGISQIRNEVQIEIETLALNDDARRAFASFSEICASASCGMFLSSSEAYAKGLLYLKDQLKDLERTGEAQVARIVDLQLSLKKVDQEIASIESARSSKEEEQGVSALVDAISALNRRVFDLQSELDQAQELLAREKRFVALLAERGRVQDELAQLSGTPGEADLRAIQVRSVFRERIARWLDVLQTMNVSRDVEVDTDFGVTFGGEKVGQIKGSTLVRVVLAIRTAAFETYADEASSGMRFFILDTPRQQDIDRVSLSNYIAELRALATARNFQVVFSTTDYHYDCGPDDREWRPTFAGFKQPMFLGRSRISDLGPMEKAKD